MSVPPKTLPPLCVVSGALPLGGSTTFVLNLARGLKLCSPPLHVICMEDSCPMAREFEKSGIHLQILSRSGKIFEDTISETYSQLATIQPSAVLANLSSESFELLRMVPPGVRRLGIIHSDDPGPYAMAKQFAPWLDGLIGVSHKICETIRSIPEFVKVAVHHIPYGIPFDDNTVPALRKNDGLLRVIYLGRLVEEQKRISRIAEVINLSSSARLPVHFTIAGSGPQEQEFLEAIANLKNVNFLGHLPNTAIANCLREQDIYLLLSDFEGLPLSLLEAMGEGVVPVVPDMPGGIQEVVTDSNGIRLKETTAECAILALRQLAASSESLSALSSAARTSVRTKYTAAAMAEKVMSLTKSASKNTHWPTSQFVPPPLGVQPSIAFAPIFRPLRRILKSRIARSSE